MAGLMKPGDYWIELLVAGGLALALAVAIFDHCFP